MPGISSQNVPESMTMKEFKDAGPLADSNGEIADKDQTSTFTTECKECKAVSKAPKVCGNCWQTVYCSRAHQVSGWENHQKECYPWKIAYDPDVGRYMMATRDIRAGELLLQESPLIIGPKTITEPVCLGCYKPATGDFMCEDCGFPMCDQDCSESPSHEPECKAVQYSGINVKVSLFGEPNCMYECITPIRILFMREAEPRQWDRIMNLESHADKRYDTEVAAITQTTVVEIIQERLRLDVYDEELINKIIGIIDINAFEIRLPDSSIMGVYSKAAMLEHSCIPNTHRTFDADLNLVVRAAVDIKRGDHLQSCYTESISTTTARQEHLLTSKFFTCSCKRCVDPTELKTFVSAMLCPACWADKDPSQIDSSSTEGVVVPSDPQSPTTDWVCLTCKSPIDSDYVVRITSVLTEEAEELENGTPTVEACEAFLEKWAPTFHPHFAGLLNVKYILMQQYGYLDGYLLEDMSPAQLVRKETICRHLLKVSNVILPGISRFRGTILYELYRTLFYKSCAMFQNGVISNDAAKKIAQEGYECLLECARVLCYEPPVQPEGQLGLEAKDELKQMIRFIKEQGWKG